MRLQITIGLNSGFEEGETLVLQTAQRKLRRNIGIVRKVRGPHIIVDVFRKQTKYMQNRLQKYKTLQTLTKILPDYNHPLTKIFR